MHSESLKSSRFRRGISCYGSNGCFPDVRQGVFVVKKSKAPSQNTASSLGSADFVVAISLENANTDHNVRVSRPRGSNNECGAECGGSFESFISMFTRG